ncbi:MAG TPA: FAD-dependent monooxygenase [Mycobacteriales bacterium]
MALSSGGFAGNDRTPAELLDVLVVGAGPTGLTLAAQLREYGVRFRVVDRIAGPARESRALAVQARTLELLRTLGLHRALLDRGRSAVVLQLHAGSRTVDVPLFDEGVRDTEFPFLLFVSQAETEQVLNEHLAGRGVPVERGRELTGWTEQDDGLTCTVRDRDGTVESVRTRYLIGCDGAHSTVRTVAGIGFTGGRYRQTFALADLDVAGDLRPDSVHVFVDEPGMAFFFPIKGPAPWRFTGVLPEPGDADTAAARDAGAVHGTAGSRVLRLPDVQGILDTFARGRLRLHDPVWLSSFRLEHRLAEHYRCGRVFLAGDAAHVHSPVGAQGMNTGIQDAWNLGWKLGLVVRGPAAAELLDTYHQERWPIGRFLLRFTDRGFTVATSGNPVAGVLRSRVAPRLAPLAIRVTPARALAFRTIAQLRVRYRGSAAAEEGRPALWSGPRAGDRFPDAPVRRGGAETSLQELVAAPCYHLVLVGEAAWDPRVEDAVRRYGDLVRVVRLVPGPGADRDAASDPTGAALARLGRRTPAQYVVRPDGYVGYRCGGSDLSGALRHLARWLPGAAAG